MLSNLFISILVGSGASIWFYTKLLKYTGNNKKNSAIAATVTAVVLIILVDLIIDRIIKK
jgi:hypothetical protein